MARKQKVADVHGAYWNKWRNETNSPSTALSELIDNSIDAGATRVDINVDSESLTVVDNGHGMSDEGLMRMFTLGDSSRIDDVNASGRYGHGSKVGMAHFGNVFRVESVKGGFRSLVTWDTQADVDSGIWKKGLREYKPKKSAKKPGTSLKVTKPRSRSRRPRSMLSQLCFQFSPAIENGVKIVLNGEAVKASSPPWLGTPSDAEGEVDGMRFTIRYGRLQSNEAAPGASKWQGVHTIKLNRFVNEASGWREPVNDTPLCCVVKLHSGKKDDWALNPVKTGFASQDVKDELCRQIRDICQDEIAKYEDEARTIKIREFECELNGFVSVIKKPEDQDGTHGADNGEVPKMPSPGPNPGPTPPGPPKPRPNKPTDGNTHDATGGLIEFKFSDLGDEFYSVSYDKNIGKLTIRFNIKSPAYNEQKPDHVMYIVTAALAIAAKMRDTPKLIDRLPEWKQYMEENVFDMKSHNADSRFCKWFQDKTLGFVHEQAA